MSDAGKVTLDSSSLIRHHLLTRPLFADESGVKLSDHEKLLLCLHPDNILVDARPPGVSDHELIWAPFSRQMCLLTIILDTRNSSASYGYWLPWCDDDGMKKLIDSAAPAVEEVVPRPNPGVEAVDRRTWPSQMIARREQGLAHR